jgi:large subunit ribosomal protein L29
MKAEEIRDKSDVEIHEQIDHCEKELFNLRFQIGMGQLDNSSRVSQVKKDLARCKTVLNERKKTS